MASRGSVPGPHDPPLRSVRRAGARPNIENVYAASVRVGSHNEAGGGRELVPLGLAEISARALSSASIRAVARSTSSCPATQMTTFTLRPSNGEGTRLTSPRSRPVDQPGHAGLVKLKKAGQLRDRGLAVAKDPEEAGLDNRQIVGRGDAPNGGLDCKCQLRQRVHQPEVPPPPARG